MPHRFYYLRGAFGEAGLLATHQEAIERVLYQGYTSKNIEKLQGYDIYSIRLGDAARLLFTTISYGVEDYLLVLDYLPNHEYDKSKFLKYRVLERYREQATLELERGAWDDRACLERFKKIRQDKYAPSHVVLDYYQGGYLNLNANQEEVLRLRLPAIVSGAAGSGKSCVAISLLREYQLQHPDRPLLYVASSKALVKERLKDWQQLPNFDEFKTEFKDFDTLVQESLKEGGRFVGKDDFLTWYATYLKVQKVKEKHYEPLDGDLIYEEFRICSGYELADYLALGLSQCLVNVPRREEIFHAFVRYKAFLEKHNLVDSAFYRFPLDFRRYGLIVVDESQDMSYGQAEQLHTMADRAQIVFCMDGHQRLYDRRSILPYLRSRFRIDEESRCVVLPQTYRCAPEIAHAANEMLAIKHAVLGGKVDKRDFSHLESRVDEMESTGFVHVVHPGALLAMSWSRAMGRNAQCVAVTRPEYKDELKQLFGLSDGMIYTPAEIKGLESDVVLVWKLLDSDLFKAVRPYLVEMGPQDGELHRAKKTSEHENLVQYFNALYTTYTRAKTRLFICEEPQRYTEIVYQRLQMHSKQLPLALDFEASGPAEWLAQVKKLWELQQIERAQGIYLQKVGDEDAYLRQVALWAPVVEKIAELPLLPDDASEPQVLVKVINEYLPIEKHYAQLLNLDFTKENLDLALKLCDIGKVFREPYLNQSGRNLSLLYLMQKDIKLTDEFFSWVVNHFEYITNQSLLKALSPNALDFRFKENFDRKRIIFKKIHEKFSVLAKKDLAPGITPLHIAVQFNFTTEFDDLCRLGANINATDELGSTPAYLAAYYGSEDFIEKLYALNADLNLKNLNGLSPIYIAVQRKYMGVLTRLKKMGVNIHQQCGKGFTLAHIASLKGHLEIMDMLFEWGLDFNKPNTLGLTPFGFAALTGNLESLIKLKKYSNVDINCGDSNGETPIFYAALNSRINIVSQLKNWGVSVHQTTNKGCNLFHYAVDANSLPLMDLLKEWEVDINHANRVGLTPLFKAIQRGSIESVVKLHQLSANLNCVLPEGWTLMHVAAENDDVAMLSQLHALGVDFNIPNSQGILPVHQAIQFGKIKAVIHLKSLGMNPHVKATDGMTLVHIAAMFNQVAMLPVFSQWGMNLNQENMACETPLFKAAQVGHIEFLLKLQDYGVNLYQPLKFGWDIFHVAANYGKAKIFDVLFKEGMDVNALTMHGETYAFKAVQQGHIDVLYKLKSLGTSTQIARQDGVSPLHIAAYYAKDNIIKLLCEWGANKEALSPMEETPIFMAVQNGHLETFKLLHELGANLHHIRQDGSNLLHIAAYCGQLSIVEQLLKWGMDIHQGNDQNQETTLMYAVKIGQLEVISRLLELGARLDSTLKNGNNVTHVAAQFGQLKILIKFAELQMNLDVHNHHGQTPLFIAAQKGYLEAVKFLFPLSAYDSFMIASLKTFEKFIMKDPKFTHRGEAWLHQYLQVNGGDSTKIIIYPHDIAEMMGHIDVATYLKANIVQEKIASPRTLGFFSLRSQSLTPVETKALKF